MKRLFFILLATIPFFAFSQNTIIIQQQQNNSSYNSNNSLSQPEDIGGVDVSTEYSGGPYARYYVNFKNYRNIAVTVKYKFTINKINEEEVTGSITLGPNETKRLNGDYFKPRNFNLTVRPL